MPGAGGIRARKEVPGKIAMKAQKSIPHAGARRVIVSNVDAAEAECEMRIAEH